MVIQQDTPVHVWGTALPGENITIQLADQNAGVQANNTGGWSPTLSPLPVGGPYTLVVQGTNTIVLNDILSGEVWLASGQSNMVWPLANSDNGPALVQQANQPYN
jgi:sialate O-acetylesterase